MSSQFNSLQSPDIPTYTDQAPPRPQSKYTADTLVPSRLLHLSLYWYCAHCVVCQHNIDELISHIILFMHTASARIHAIKPKFPPLPLASSPHPSLHPMLGCGAHICKAGIHSSVHSCISVTAACWPSDHSPPRRWDGSIMITRGSWGSRVFNKSFQY